ncbi:MAG: universal stress protein [Pseudomonadota bacterium]
MPIHTVTTILTGSAGLETQLHKAIAFARAYDAHLQVFTLAVGYDQPAGLAGALGAVPVASELADGRLQAQALAEKATTILKPDDIRWDILSIAVARANLAQCLAQHTRFSDLVILHRAKGEATEEAHVSLVQALLFDADTPLFVLPQASEMKVPARAIMLAWDESSTALRAAKLAMPLLQAANTVHIALVEPAKDASDRSDPGGAFAHFIARHGVRNEVSVLNKTDDTVAQTLERRAKEIGCDLIVMGAYGHSRLRQALFGGTTRSMLEKSTLPILLAH